MARTRDYYAVLGVPPRAHARVVEERYWEQAHELHQEPTKKAARRLMMINEAYEVLGSPHRREAYDRKRAEAIARQDDAAQAPRFIQSFVNLLGKAFRPD